MKNTNQPQEETNNEQSIAAANALSELTEQMISASEGMDLENFDSEAAIRAAGVLPKIYQLASFSGIMQAFRVLLGNSADVSNSISEQVSEISPAASPVTEQIQATGKVYAELLALMEKIAADNQETYKAFCELLAPVGRKEVLETIQNVENQVKDMSLQGFQHAVEASHLFTD
jgi:hypothetical protein